MKSAFGPVSEKRIPESKKYSHIESSIDTGAAKKTGAAPSTSGIAKKRDEIFKRIPAAKLVQLLQEREGQENESVYAMGPGSDAGAGSHCGISALSVIASKAGGRAPTQASLAASVTSVAGSVLSVIESDMTVSEARDLILLDLREPEEYAKCHLPMAESYPATKLNRDQFSAELHRCKRDSSKLLVVYHVNDAQTAAAASLLVQKGWESATCLSGGFEEIACSYPEVLQGEAPERPTSGATSRASRR
eukprot:TRINITY_DN112186_c0_g1_i1.p1 TRINITY_DN112186_c0_g1~~TRINITY_DN112186_c0_g1_i1.p1  ORF type:complete len:248 (+),score=39.40 TRINITY_DN112186_c0_g1_i1:109-852(+)